MPCICYELEISWEKILGYMEEGKWSLAWDSHYIAWLVVHVIIKSIQYQPNSILIHVDHTLMKGRPCKNCGDTPYWMNYLLSSCEQTLYSLECSHYLWVCSALHSTAYHILPTTLRPLIKQLARHTSPHTMYINLSFQLSLNNLQDRCT